MKKSPFYLILLAMVIGLFTQCTSLFDEAYQRPSWLEPPIYELLQKDGRFTGYLKCVDSTLYARILKSASNYTVFAPTDEAFDLYLQKSGRLTFPANASAKDSAAARSEAIAKISPAEADTIVAYSMVFNNFQFNELTDVLTKGWDTLSSIKKKTAFYEELHQEPYNGDTVWVIDATSDGAAVIGENNYKFMPTYLSRIFNKRSLTNVDYETFYDRAYTGENVQNASIVTKDMYAENGIVHAVDRVNKPLPNLENLIKADTTLSSFNNILDAHNPGGDYIFKTFVSDDALTQYYKELYPQRNIDKVYVKFYTGLPISPSTEKVGFTDKLAETTGYSMVLPSNKAVQKFYNEKIKPFATKLGYNSINDVPVSLWSLFLNSHMSKDLIWPSRFSSSMNANSEFYNGMGSTGKSFTDMNFKSTRVASNGFLYTLDDTTYIHPKQFETVFGQLLLDPDFSWMAAALNKYYGSALQDELMRSPLNGYNSEYYIVFLMSNTALARNGYTMTITDGEPSFGNQDCSSGLLTAEERLKRLIRSCVFVRIRNGQMDNTLNNFFAKGSVVAPSNGFKSYGFEVAVNYYGDMVKMLCPTAAANQNMMQIQMLGKYDYGTSSYLVGTKLTNLKFNNGVVYTLGPNDLLDYCNSPVTWDEKTLGTYLLDQACVNDANLTTYKQYATKVLFSTTSTGWTMPEEIGAMDQLTILAPNNTAMAKAQTDGYLPKYADLTTDANIKKARDFLLLHILNGRVLVNDMDTTKMNGTGVIYDNKTASFATTVTLPTYYVSGKNSMLVDVTKASDGCLQFQTNSSTSTSVNATPVKITLSTQTNNKKYSNLYCRRGVIHEINGYLPCTPIQK
jgi:uncharacterized surface protein with fasciclin (FAS1) repeats